MNPQSMNSYSYAEGNPVNRKDPSGLATVKGSYNEILKNTVKLLNDYKSFLQTANSNKTGTAKAVAKSTYSTAKNVITNPGGIAYDAAVSTRNSINTFRNGSDAVQDQMIGKWVVGAAGVILPGKFKSSRSLPGGGVIDETLSGSGNITSASRLSSSDALTTGEQFLGTGYIQLGKPDSGVFRSADGLRQFRIDEGSINGPRPHVSFEAYQLGQTTKPYVNNHVYLTD